MSMVGSRKEMPPLQENSQQAAQASDSTDLERSFRNREGKDHRADSSVFCLGGRLLQSGCSEAPGNSAAFKEAFKEEAGLLTRCPKRVEKLRNLMSGEIQPQTVPQHVTRTTGELTCFRKSHCV